MLAKKIVFFLWGGALASVWWQAAMFGHGDLRPLWLVAGLGTLATVVRAVGVFETHWKD